MPKVITRQGIAFFAFYLGSIMFEVSNTIQSGEECTNTSERNLLSVGLKKGEAGSFGEASHCASPSQYLTSFSGSLPHL